MRQRVHVSLPADLKEQLDKVCQEEGVSPGDVVRRSLREYLFARRLRILRGRMLTKARAQGIHTDQDVFDRVS